MKEIYFHLPAERYEICCKQYFPDCGPTENVVLGVHGFAGDKESSALRKLGEALTEVRGTLLCFDLPAHGDSPVDGNSLTVANCASDLRHMLDYCRQQYPEANKGVFATSFGGFLTLVCSDALMKGDVPEFRSVLRAPAVTMPDILLPVAGLSSPEEFRRLGRIQHGFPGERELWVQYAFYEELQAYDLFRTDFLCHEFLIIHGERDDIVPFADVERFCKEMNRKYGKIGPTVQFFSIPQADHRFKGIGEIEKVIRLAMGYWRLPVSK